MGVSFGPPFWSAMWTTESIVSFRRPPVRRQDRQCVHRGIACLEQPLFLRDTGLSAAHLCPFTDGHISELCSGRGNAARMRWRLSDASLLHLSPDLPLAVI
eukprot:5881663-Pleurochrysis_carterae.AAC.2